uniref:Uncharacterized protein n=1 Tax=Tanacetum cinerariifolium TaxID=118510 RepID=A0A699SKM1_TANCI|nr:hypothetical protein [Tanacetum cinerariifolium]
MDEDKDVTLKDVAVVAKDVQDVLSMEDVDIEPVELQEVVEVVTTAKLDFGKGPLRFQHPVKVVVDVEVIMVEQLGMVVV